MMMQWSILTNSYFSGGVKPPISYWCFCFFAFDHIHLLLDSCKKTLRWYSRNHE
jgi:hypothetical protein